MKEVEPKKNSRTEWNLNLSEKKMKEESNVSTEGKLSSLSDWLNIFFLTKSFCFS